MQYLCSTFGSSGDVFPMLGLALELQQRGHEVTLATNDHFRPVVERNGLSFVPLGTETEYQSCIQNPDLWDSNPTRGFRHVFRSFQPVLKRQYELHVELAARGPLVGLTNCFGFGALNAQDKLGIPVLSVHLQPSVIWSKQAPPALVNLFGPRWFKDWLYGLGERFVIEPIVCPFLNTWRHELGLSPVRRLTRWWHSRDGVVCLFPDWFAPPQTDWPQPLLQADFPLWNDQSSQPLPADVELFLRQGDPPLVFTPGSANLHGREFFTAAVAACHQLERRGILLTQFREQVPENLPATVAHFSYVPLDLLLPKSSAFIHHGGVGSLSQGFLAGVPQLLMPLAHDQFDNAARLKRLGCGTSLARHRFTGRNLAAALAPLLDNPETSRSCTDLANRLRGQRGLSLAADLIEKQDFSERPHAV